MILNWFFNFRSENIKKRKYRKKDSILDELSDLEIKRKPKIKYGGLTSSDEDTGRRRTRGKKTTYVDTLGSDSEEVNNRFGNLFLNQTFLSYFIHYRNERSETLTDTLTATMKTMKTL